MRRLGQPFNYKYLNITVKSYPGGSMPIYAVYLKMALVWREVYCAEPEIGLPADIYQSSIMVHQVVGWKNKAYLLTRLGFGSASVSKIVTVIIKWVLTADLP